MNKPHYRKPQAVRELERMALDHFRRDHPNFPEYAIPPQSYRDNTANGLTKCIVDYIRYNGGQAERVATIGMPEQRGGRIVWRKSNTTKGSADISATIAGRSVKIEVKIGLDHQSEAQRRYRRTDAKPYVVNKLREQIAALENCVDLNDSKVDNQLLILLRDTLYKALYVENRADVLIVGMRLTNHPEI